MVLRLTVVRGALGDGRAIGTRATVGRVPVPARDGDTDTGGDAAGKDGGSAVGGDGRGGAAVRATSSMRRNAAPHASIAQRAISVATKRSADHCIANDDASVSHSARSTGDAGSR